MDEQVDPRRTSREVSTREAAAALGVTERTVRRAIMRGELAAVKRGAAYGIDSRALARFAARTERSASPHPVVRLALFPTPDHDFAPLPAPLSPFIGREADRTALTTLLIDPAVRLVTLTGPGGVGKTRLAIAAAASVRDRFPNGIVFVALATVSLSEHVVPAIADALGLREIAGRDRHAQVRAFLRAKRLLLVLDNFEQILAAAPEVALLAAEAPGLTVLITSRAPLHVGGEHEVPVPPMALARERASLDELMTSDAGHLFVARVREHEPSFTVDEESAPHIADICARLDGLPLAIELAAARVKVLPPRQLHNQLQRRLPLLTGGFRDAPNRHATMRDAIAWSYDLLSAEEQRLFRRLSVFVGGCTLEAVEAIGYRLSTIGESVNAGLPRVEHSSPITLDLVASLVDQNLLARETGLDGEPRYRMLETIREYGLDQLEAGEEVAVRSAHARYYLDLAWELRSLANTRSTRASLDRLAADDDNVRGALGWLDAHGEATDFARMVAACYTFLFARSRFREAESWLDRALAKSDLMPIADHARLLIGSAEFLMIKGQFSRAGVIFAEVFPLIRALGDPFDLAMALISGGAALNYDGRYAQGEAYLSEALSLAEAVDEETLRAAVATRALANLSLSARGQGDLDVAAARSEEALRLCRGYGFDLAETRTLMDLGDIAKDQGNYHLAAARYLECIEQTGERGETRLVADILSGMASVATAWEQHRAALLLLGAAIALRERIGFGMLLPVDVATLDRDLAALHAVLGEQEVAAIVREGQALPLADAITIATAVTPGSALPASSAGSRGELTPREREVLHLLAKSLSDREIAEALYLSPRTVSWHVRSLLAKLGATSRRDVIAQARGAGLI